MTKVVLITGASSGIGKSVAEFLVKKGLIVYGTSRNPKQDNVNGVLMLALDVNDQFSIENALKTIINKESRLDILVNNAGMGITGPIEDTPIKEMRRVFDTNFFGAIALIKQVLPLMRNQGSGLIINITSIAGYMGLPFRGLYSASKGALELITEALSMEIKNFNIDICNIAPGDFATNIAAGRYHTPVSSDSAYKLAYKKNLALIDSDVNAGKPPLIMAEAVYKVIQSKQIKIHYKVGGFMEKFSIVLKRILPDRMYESILMKHYKL